MKSWIGKNKMSRLKELRKYVDERLCDEFGM
jgi:hypothetical protein